MFKCVVIDDEELARMLLKSYIDQLDFLEFVKEFENPLEAMATLKSGTIDVVFLDIQMPEIKGTDFANMIPQNTKIIFTTAYSEYAIKGFELNALDYLLKPITFERFLKAVSKLESNIAKKEINNKTTLTVKSGYDLHKLNIDEILYIESDSEYVIFHTSNKKIMSNQSLKSLEKTLDAAIFMRVHRSFIVNITKVTTLKGRDLILTDILIPVSDSYYENVKKELF
ncbi:LytTR family DNA-binding domain-containing protein [Wenyingzhuangia sp. 2_MG-2023]|uniref:LytR/AlgR family response regulator transcription factor n=1 Tax=Wenyingzhuangia sp. 2_MG-2023 TaxID=3062639 RepID=UPI0026E2F732|nr:LytTR family DNA-binding domain-containing protein [Wenyingzhuangia sp. 2_MG-2023]MDO6737441.1 LytTR family DNA-binding domain-containing protein [Wenyingzhuangia sp. 2_MG-2023]MDO6803169.1 LytTR family DNA-binding domain-containing protein [Wenyingzhuangia sp. 1_MG-2023]